MIKAIDMEHPNITELKVIIRCRIIHLFVALYWINCFNLGIELYKPNQSYVGQSLVHCLCIPTCSVFNF